MASSSIEFWRVIVVADDEELEKNYRLPPHTLISEILARWQLHQGLSGDWKFKSEDREVEYDMNSSLAEVGESKPGAKMVVLTAELPSLPTPKDTENIHLFMNGTAKKISVKPRYRLSKVLPNMTENCILEYNGKLINRNRTIKQLGIVENGVISVHQTFAVELTDKSHQKISVSQDSFICHLKNALKEYEKNDCCLKSDDRILCQNEPLREHTKPVTVHRSKIVVRIGEKMFSWEVNGGKVELNDFIARLSEISGIGRMTLRRHVFVCSGCGRRMRCEEEDFQALNIDCCRQRSMDLKVEERLIRKHCGTSTVSIPQKLPTPARAKMTRRRTVFDSHQVKESPVKDASTQYFPIIKVSFFLRDFANARRRGDADLYLPKQPTVGDVRRAVLEVMGRRSEETLITQQTAVSRRTGKRLFLTYNGFTSVDGAEKLNLSEELMDMRTRLLKNDDEQFILLPAEHRLWLSIHPC